MADEVDVVAMRQPDPGKRGSFRRTFLMRLGDIAENVVRDITLPVHHWNAREVERDAVRRGIRPTGDVTVDNVEVRSDGVTAVTYSVPVKPTDAAANVSTAKVPAAPPVRTVPEPEFTAEPVTAAESPVPAPRVDETD